MRLNRYFWGFSGVIVLAYLAIMVYVRVDNGPQIQASRYQQWRSHYVVKLPHQQALVNANAGQGRTRLALSEGQGYGMLITVAAAQRGLATRADFQRFVNYYLAHRDRHQGQVTALMSWRQYYSPTGQQVKQNSHSATDGDLMIAQALLQAERQWPGHGYQRLAKRLLTAILRFEYNPTTRALTVGNWARPRTAAGRLFRTSDVMPTAFDEFYQATGDSRWRQIKHTMLKRLNQLSHQHASGLVPDFAYLTTHGATPVKPQTVEGNNDGNYAGNACRVPLMLAKSQDPLAVDTEQRLLRFFDHQSTLWAGYTLTGRPLHHYQAASVTAPIFAAVSAHKNEGYDALFVRGRSVVERPLPTNSYYSATLTTLVALWQ